MTTRAAAARIGLALLLVTGSQSAGHAQHAGAPIAIQPPQPSIDPVQQPGPQRENDFIALIEKSQAQYAAAKSVDARKGARIAQQIAVHDFMGLTHNARDWIGTFKNSKLTQEGDRSLEIEIAPGATVATWGTRDVDGRYHTLIHRYSPLFSAITGLAIGDPVMFSGTLIGSVASSDDDMVRHPRLIATFDALKKIQ